MLTLTDDVEGATNECRRHGAVPNRNYDTCRIGYTVGRMSRIKKKEIKEIRISVEKEFTEDPALQQVHIARKIIAKEADSEGLSILDYIKLLVKQVKNVG